ncbi:dnaK protein [Histomonas meleagridis]|uniref:dnaK protein n=1 Tax=Histomonas meleagridis TaxID=135588 RepID=UPI003559FE2A|nr:dnaK protein [Histomonas meleagridis]KAH0799733.1 dnaK protein [Histomonas meleagridis]
MFACVFLVLSLSTIIGIDMGESTIKVACGSQGRPIHIVKVFDSSSKFPNFISFWDNRDHSRSLRPQTLLSNVAWEFGKEARNSLLRYPDSVIKGNTFNNKRYYDYIYGYEITALKLLHIINKVKEVERINDQIDVVIALPPSTSAIEKSFLYSALTIAKINAIQFVPSTFTSSAVYGNEHFKSSQPKTIGFLDIGSKGTRFTISKFTQDTVEEIASFFDESIGGKTIDEKFADMLSARYSIDLRQSRDYESFLEKVHQAKEKLSEKTSVTFSFNGRTINVNRKDLDSCLGDIYQFLYDAHKSIEELNIRMDSIEVVGDSTKSPLISSCISATFGISAHHTLDSFSTNAKGACYLGAAQKNIFFTSGKRNLQLIPKLTHGSTLRSQYINDFVIFEKGEPEATERQIQIPVHTDEVFHIVDKASGDEFLRFAVPTNRYQNVDISFMTNYFLMPIPNAAALSSNGNPLKIDYKTIGWEVTSEKLADSQRRVDSLVSNGRSVRRCKIARDFGIELDEASSSVKGFSIRNIAIRFLISYYKGWLEKAVRNYKSSEQIEFKANKFRRIYEFLKPKKNVDEDGKRRHLIERYHTWMTTCEMLGCATYDIRRWEQREMDTASNDEIRSKIRVLKEMALRTQDDL